MLPQVRSYPDSHFRNGITLSSSISATPVEDLAVARKLAREFSSSVFDNLDDFPYLYFTAGVTEAINFLIPQQPVTVINGEYRYVRAFENVTTAPTETRFLSYPFSWSGNFLDLSKIATTTNNLILDCSYIFASNMANQRIVPQNTTHIMFGVSKSHNLYDARSGWMFSKKRYLTLHTLQYEYGYSSSLHLKILECISKEQPNMLYNKYRDVFSSLYKSDNLIEGNSNLFALTPDKLDRKMYYDILDV